MKKSIIILTVLIGIGFLGLGLGTPRRLNSRPVFIPTGGPVPMVTWGNRSIFPWSAA